MSAIVVGELEYGFRNDRRYQANRTPLDEFLAESYVDFLTITRDTTMQYGVISTQLRQTYRKIPTYNAWIAAHAREHDAALWTRGRHFDAVAHLSLRAW